MKITRILAPVDFSRHSRRALGQADALAVQNHARLTVLHAQRLHREPVAWTAYGRSEEEVAREVSMALEVELQRWATELHTPQDRVELKIIIGAPAEAIVHEADNHDLVVIASHGRSGNNRLSLGSVADRVVRASLTPVLVIKVRAELD